ncbi:MAG: M14 family metallopeptidase [Bacillota bacterium]|nr:M14 family metallopeptidase [Bacillota bacterium]
MTSKGNQTAAEGVGIVLRRPQGYPVYQEIAGFLEQCATAHPELCTVYSIGRSHGGRDILCCELTARATGPGRDKPAYHLDANHHAGEVTGSAAALYTIWYVLTRYGQDEAVTRLLDEQVLYVVPRVAVDGAEVYLTTPEMMRSSVRLYPEAEEKEGLYAADIDSDGHILTMRQEDPNGSWKVSAKDDRLMIRRAPGESGGQYYRLYVEGLIRDYDGVSVRPAPAKWGLDFNRNYPGTWAPEHVQAGAGPYPGSEPEVRSIIEFVAAHPNIVGAMSHHTMGGMVLRPHCAKPDEKLPRGDVAVLKALSEIGDRLIGYPTWSIYEEFTVDKDRPPVGSWMDWMYDLNGVLPLATELWDMNQHAGLPKRKPKEMMELSSDEIEAVGLAQLTWNDRVLAGTGFVRWRQFRHPQLGPVELGGWLPKTVRQNPPPGLLEGECHRATVFTLAHAAVAPRLRITSCEAEGIGTGADGKTLYKVTAVLENQGYLPTNVTQQAIVMKTAKPLQVRLSAPDGGELAFVSGKARTEPDHLPGHAVGLSAHGFLSGAPEGRKRLEWAVKARPGQVLRIEAGSDKCGRRSREITLPGV